ncbi:MAG: AAA-like domain-containing protein [Pseudomonadota bacterium]
MSKLHVVQQTKSQTPAGEIVFVHGLGGDAFGTWQSDGEETFWPQWLGDDLPGLNIYSLDYEVSASAWRGTTMPLADRATNTLDLFRAHSIGNCPLFFICHSLGGLLTKQILRHGQELQNPAWAKIVEQTRGLAFLSTPHAGAELAGWADFLGKMLRKTVTLNELKAHDPSLRALNVWYRNNAEKLGIETLCFFETQPYLGIQVVNATSADPGISGVTPIPMDDDHISICKPASRDSQLYLSIRRTASDLFKCGEPLAIADFADNEQVDKAIKPARERAAKLFISYRRSVKFDEQLAQYLRENLAQAGSEIFIDVGMQVGTDWVAEIRRRIDWCDYLIVLLSEQSIHSEMVQGEVRLAHQKRKRDGSPQILPVRVCYDGPLDYELDSYLGRVQYVTWNSKQDSERALTAIKSAIDGHADCADLLELKVIEASNIPDAVSVEPSSFRPNPVVDPRVLRAPGGSIRINDPVYVRRRADERVESTARMLGETLVIRAPRQTGKSSLLVRYLAACMEANKHIAYIDFQNFSDEELEDYETLLNALKSELARSLRLEVSGESKITTQRDLTNHIEDEILTLIGAPVTIAFDEVDRVLGRPYQHDFFSMLRNWHNRRSEPLSPWEDVDLALVIATEPYLLIDSGDRSPFNVTPPIELQSFVRADLGELNDRYGTPLGDEQLDRLHQLLHGQPFLSRLSFYRLTTSGSIKFEELLEQADDINGPFSDHLRHLLMLLERQKDLPSAMMQLITKGAAPTRDTYFRLEGAGLVRRDGDRVVPANLLYARFFKRVL